MEKLLYISKYRQSKNFHQQKQNHIVVEEDLQKIELLTWNVNVNLKTKETINCRHERKKKKKKEHRNSRRIRKQEGSFGDKNRGRHDQLRIDIPSLPLQ